MSTHLTQRRSRAAAALLIVSGLVLGTLTVIVDLIGALAGTVRPAAARRVVQWERWRLTTCLGHRLQAEPRAWRAVGYLATRAIIGALGGVILLLITAGVVVSGAIIVGAATNGPVALFDTRPGEVTFATVALFVVPGIVLLFLAVQGLVGIVRLERTLWMRFALPGGTELAERVSRLSGTLDDVMELIDDERRRIERDIHDGVQQRVVALGLLLARAERVADVEERWRLQGRARAETQAILADLRDVAWRIYPATLDHDGLEAALETLAERSVLPVVVAVDLDDRLPRAVEAAAFFVASEAVTNALKHARATRVDISAHRRAGSLAVTIRDDGVGGANPEGPGLAGLASRAAALDGRLTVESSVGRGTSIRLEVPCA